MPELNALLRGIDSELDNSVARLFELARITSISTDPRYKEECRKAARWLTDDLARCGFDAALRDTPGHPMVVAHYNHPSHSPKTPHLLFYGHYDVQPADPLGKWQTPPFDPVRRRDSDGTERLYGRGLSDDKGQLMTFVEAFRLWLGVIGPLPIRATVLIEGEEESGSPSLIPFLKANRQELSCDAAFICDTGMWNERTPAITTRLRGLMHEEITILGPRVDLHSGTYGGPAINPIRVLSRVIASFHDRSGRVTIPGFYEGVDELPPEIRKQWRALKFSETGFLQSVGLSVPAGEKGRMVLEQVWSRPTLEVNGIYGGYTGKGTKTVLPAEATAKISCRLVGRQNPRKLRAALRRHVKALLPKDCRARFGSRAGSAAIVVPRDNPLMARAAAGLKDEFGCEPVLIGSGGSIPVVRQFKDILKMDSILLGFALNDDAIHSPNEKYDLRSYHRGIRSWARIISRLTNSGK
jgi:acetylornithine deacetylase/succinyl-diaminopimelate desuccinylase-like protein